MIYRSWYQFAFEVAKSADIWYYTDSRWSIKFKSIWIKDAYVRQYGKASKNDCGSIFNKNKTTNTNRETTGMFGRSLKVFWKKCTCCGSIYLQYT